MKSVYVIGVIPELYFITFNSQLIYISHNISNQMFKSYINKVFGKILAYGCAKILIIKTIKRIVQMSLITSSGNIL